MHGSPGNEVAHPVLGHAEAVGDDRIGRIGLRQVRPHIGPVVTQLAEDGGHAVEGPVHEIQVFLVAHHGGRR
jgi:hypothetical protein